MALVRSGAVQRCGTVPALCVFLVVGLAFAAAAEAGRKPTGLAGKVVAGAARPMKRHKLRIGAQLGAGFDSNLFAKPTEAQGALLGELGLKAKYDFKASKRFKLQTGGKFGTSYRHAAEDARGLKLKLGAKAGLRWRLFGSGPTARRYRTTGIFAAAFKYAGTFTPVYETPAPIEPPVEEEDVVEDTLEDELAAADELEEDEEADDESDDEEDEEAAGDGAADDEGDDEGEVDAEEAEEEELDEFFDGDPAGGTLFTSKPSRHVTGGNASFDLAPWRFTALRLKGKTAFGDVGETAGKESKDYWQLGGGVRLQQKLLRKRLTLGVSYDLDYRPFVEKTLPATGDPFEMMSHALGAAVKVKPIKRLKINVGYRLGLRSVLDSELPSSTVHQIRVGLAVKIFEPLRVFQENSFLLTGVDGDPDKSVFRYQGLAGVRWIM